MAEVIVELITHNVTLNDLQLDDLEVAVWVLAIVL